MSFTPIVPASGYAGWAFLQRTMDAQKAAFDAAPAAQTEEEYFRKNIGKIGSAGELVSDRRLLKVALGAFGLEGDIGNTFFIRKVLEEGVTEKSALANKLSDKSYLALAEAFGFGETTAPNTGKPEFAGDILKKYSTQQFATAVGEQDADMRLALNAQTELAELAAKNTSGTSKWYAVLGSAPLRQVFETAFGLPSAFASLDLDQQVRAMESKMKSLLGTESVATFTDPEQVDKLLKRFLTMSQITNGTATSPALQILQSGGSAMNILSLLR